MKNYLIFIFSVTAIAILPSNASAYGGTYSHKTTAFSTAYGPANMNARYGYSYVPNLRASNPYEARHVDYVLTKERYQRQLDELKAQRDARYAMDRAQRLQSGDLFTSTYTQQGNRSFNNRSVAHVSSARSNVVHRSVISTRPAHVQLQPVNTTTSVVSNADFDVLSNSLESNTNFNYRPSRQVVSMTDSASQPSFFQRLRWALFGRN